MCRSLEKRGDGDRERDRDRPGFKGPFGLLRSRRTKKVKMDYQQIIITNIQNCIRMLFLGPIQLLYEFSRIDQGPNRKSLAGSNQYPTSTVAENH